jgi:hypothetical protein
VAGKVLTVIHRTGTPNLLVQRSLVEVVVAAQIQLHHLTMLPVHLVYLDKVMREEIMLVTPVVAAVLDKQDLMEMIL